jgi:hypothetical protein
MIEFQGLTLNGTYLGTRIQHSKPDQNGQTKQTLFAGFEVSTTGQYGETKTEVLEAVLSDALIKAGLAQKLAKFEGQFLSVPVWARVWQGQKSSGVTYYVDKQAEKLGA